VEAATTKKKPGVVVEQLRIKEKTVLDELNRISTAAMINEKAQKSSLKVIEGKITGMEKKVSNNKKRQKAVKAETEAAINQWENVRAQICDLDFNVGVRNEFLHKFFKVDSEYKCTDLRLCQEYHMGGCCFQKEKEPQT